MASAAKKVKKNKKNKKTKLTLSKSPVLANSKKNARKINRRKFPRYKTNNLWVTELSDDHQYTCEAENLSLSGIFLKGRLKTTLSPSRMFIHLGSDQSLLISANPVRDQIKDGNCGAGYQFVEISSEQTMALKNFLRNFD